VKTDPKFVETFLLALNDLADKGAAGFLAAIDLDGVETLLDLGGGAAGYACILARAYPKLTITLVDLPDIVPLSRRVIAERGLTARIQVQPGDIFQDDFGIAPASFDAVLVSHLLHDFPEAPCRAILRQAWRSARAGGRIIVNDVFTGAGPLKLPETFFDLMMQVENPGGASHPLPAVETWMRDAGWTDLRYHALYFGGLVEGLRAGR
jgi:ubiquinone/menaquinone biosynthesis C-methylase UbiE